MRHLWRRSILASTIAVVLLSITTQVGADDLPYVELYASSGTLFNEHTNEDGSSHWAKSEYLGLKAVGRLPLIYDLSLVGRAEVKGVPGSFVYNNPNSFTGLSGDLGVSWTPMGRGDWRLGGLLTYGEVWNLSTGEEWTATGRSSNAGGGLIARYEPAHSWIAAGIISCKFYGEGALPRLVLHAGLFPAVAMEADFIWGDHPSASVSVNVGWKK